MKIGDIVTRIMNTRPVRVFTHFNQSRGPVLAAGMAYQAIFAIFAALWLVFSVAGIWLASNPDLMDQLFVIINQSVPGLIGKEGVIDPKSLGDTGALTWSSAIALIGLLATTLGWLSTTSQAVRGIFGMGQETTFFVLVKLRELGLGLAFGLALVVSAVISIISTELLRGFLGLLGQGTDSFWFVASSQAVALLIVLIIDTITLAALFRVLSRVRIPLRNLLVGSLLGAVVLGVLKVLGAALLGGAARNPLLAGFAVIIGLLIWFNLTSTVTLISAAWIAVGMQDAGIPPSTLSADEAKKLTDQKEAEALRLAATVELRQARLARESASWLQRPGSNRRLRKAKQRAEKYGVSEPAER
ncbi:membrane protein [Cryobacterium sp. MP_3.1]|uniref:YihY/virulence factor BrkB family protein n=1 Tax=unclassified Cryobacterium TaxID=2649013 RepID=UPI000B4C6E33|nr:MULTISPECIES: YihY/virulence factor BrkB family protein [unclassified Cryobacterium]ASD21162.1 ribonuclease [Cryobacterium sp. LW097]MEC5183093.1 membrane protein [Cryobacterium sp. MP_3.1]TFC56480.1 YihY/virulence factor BrkB family protein [Cryobacterium sp. TMB3-1-2]TFC56547.1 YihY/virulence factor BrkB family protein [Cryobacterium sp. TMB1-7]TFC67315.1 YihY/virulence factor BrkB family protein [Cryobacterium sp. TMB3-15]